MRVTLASIGDAVITTDVEGRITSMNAVAESLTGSLQHDAVGQSLDSVFRIVNEKTRQPFENPAGKALRTGVVVGLANHTVLIRKDGTECPIDDSAAPIRDERGLVSGCVLIFRDVSAQRGVEKDKASQLLTARLPRVDHRVLRRCDCRQVARWRHSELECGSRASVRLYGGAGRGPPHLARHPA